MLPVRPLPLARRNRHVTCPYCGGYMRSFCAMKLGFSCGLESALRTSLMEDIASPDSADLSPPAPATKAHPRQRSHPDHDRTARGETNGRT
jgi:hypothetical protein